MTAPVLRWRNAQSKNRITLPIGDVIELYSYIAISIVILKLLFACVKTVKCIRKLSASNNYSIGSRVVLRFFSWIYFSFSSSCIVSGFYLCVKVHNNYNEELERGSRVTLNGKGRKKSAESRKCGWFICEQKNSFHYELKCDLQYFRRNNY